jgi:hypothetical protein
MTDKLALYQPEIATAAPAVAVTTERRTENRLCNGNQYKLAQETFELA